MGKHLSLAHLLLNMLEGLDTELRTIRSTLDEVGVSVGLLYGSMAKGSSDSESDIDIAVYIDGDPMDPEYTNKLVSLMSKLDTRIDRDVDVTDLKTSNKRFASRILDDAKVIYDPDGKGTEVINSISTIIPSKSELDSETSQLKKQLRND